ncbi:hypothetical protein [Persicobacter psychrovividus]|uniref:Uncharacterized protein n=1 Tax=Persicobacter psychrovividus TaxID=387638 RepID=A0ABM7VIG3_9BACT|nr:hypothetical protein PEPS_30440 [Persicobacter psychrovividus]
MLSAFSCYDYEISAKIENRTDFDLLLIQRDTALGHQTSDYTFTIPAKSSFDFAWGTFNENDGKKFRVTQILSGTRAPDTKTSLYIYDTLVPEWKLVTNWKGGWFHKPSATDNHFYNVTSWEEKQIGADHYQITFTITSDDFGRGISK